MNHVFVYGTLKEGFANFGINAGRRLPGVFRTVERFPLFIVGETHIPWLVNEPGQGEQVLGQVFEVSDPVLEEMDRLERINEQGWYTRVEIMVQLLGAPASPPTKVFVYFGSAERVRSGPVQAGPLVEFTAQHNGRYRRNAA